MKFRARLFTVLSILALIWLCGGSALAISSAQNVASTPPSDIQNRGAYAFGAGIGGSVVIALVICTGLPALAVFLFLGWRNRVGIRTDLQHRELIAAVQHDERT